MTAPTISHPAPACVAVSARPLAVPDSPAGGVLQQLQDLASQVSGWQLTLLRASAEVAAVATQLSDPGPPGLPPAASGAAQVQAMVSAAAEAAEVTWLCFDGMPAVLPAGREALSSVIARALTRCAQVRVLACAPQASQACELAAAITGLPGGSVRVARCPLGMPATGDLVITGDCGAIAVAAEPDGRVSAERIPGPMATALICAMAGTLWEAALPSATARRLGEIASDPLKMAILALLQDGAKDELIARAVGVSLRTCRRHIAELLDSADAVSRFQAASRLARGGLLAPAS